MNFADAMALAYDAGYIYGASRPADEWPDDQHLDSILGCLGIGDELADSARWAIMSRWFGGVVAAMVDLPKK